MKELTPKVKVSAVAYTNTKPFVYGLEHASIIRDIELLKDIPSDCAAKLIDGRVDIGLIPVAAIPDVPNAEIISDYCIGSVGAVNSVFIFSNVPVTEIKTVKLDPQSRTSNNLARILLKNYWKQSVTFVNDSSVETDALVLIGDRTFGKINSYPFAYDMGTEWMNFTGLPFVYAAWVANKPLSSEFMTKFNEALKWGLDHRSELIKILPAVAEFDLEDYLMHKLDFELTSDKRKALALYLRYLSEL